VLGKLGGTLLIVALTASLPARGGEELAIVGTYTKDEVCRGSAAKRKDLLVRITDKEIVSDLGTCTILHRNRNGKTIAMQLECKVPGDQLILGDVTFTIRDEHTLDFDDQDHTSPAVLHRCRDE
jgi:hypothetical protein